ncbi:unnamed protein product [Brugia timori]|uniref:Four helix bundle protein n=1 Tax=Brugia timori TaxID=42155 RepID=A0A0R3QRX7_9BILA|nr:unnamed protein product [Brugia timori]
MRTNDKLFYWLMEIIEIMQLAQNFRKAREDTALESAGPARFGLLINKINKLQFSKSLRPINFIPYMTTIE